MNNISWQFFVEYLPFLCWALILLGIFFLLTWKISTKNLVVLTALTTLFLVSLGAYVRLADAGLGCPDWPGCYGKSTPIEAHDQIAKAELEHPDGPVTIEKAWTEMAHRYLASVVGIMILVILVKSIAAYRSKKDDEGLLDSVLLPLILFLSVLMQGILGKWTVTMLLKPAIVTLHLAGGIFILGCLAYMVGGYLPVISNIVRRAYLSGLVTLSIVVVFLQILLGGWVSTNYAALICIDFPLCQGNAWPQMNFSEGFNIFRELGQNSDGYILSVPAITSIQWTHRIGALIVSFILIHLIYKLYQDFNLRFYGWIILICLGLQVSLGIINVMFLLPFFAAVAHNTFAGVLLSVLVMLKSRLSHS